jgi:hypothetical protein
MINTNYTSQSTSKGSVLKQYIEKNILCVWNLHHFTKRGKMVSHTGPTKQAPAAIYQPTA